MHPPGPENGEGVTRYNADAPETQNTYDTHNVADTSTADNFKSLPPGFAWDGGSIVECELPPVEKVPLNKEQALLRTIGHACSWSDGSPVRWQAFLSCAGFDSRPISEVAESLGVSTRLVQIRVAECREWLAELREELEARP